MRIVTFIDIIQDVLITITQSLLFTDIFLKLRKEFLIERRIHHLLIPTDLLPILGECEKNGILVRPLETVEGRVSPRGGIDDRLTLQGIVYDLVDMQLVCNIRCCD